MRKPDITFLEKVNALIIHYYEGVMVGTLTNSHMASITIHDVTKEELEYMASELKRIADTMEG